VNLGVTSSSSKRPSPVEKAAVRSSTAMPPMALVGGGGGGRSASEDLASALASPAPALDQDMDVSRGERLQRVLTKGRRQPPLGSPLRQIPEDSGPGLHAGGPEVEAAAEHS
jgi:hypothetical protein